MTSSRRILALLLGGGLLLSGCLGTAGGRIPTAELAGPVADVESLEEADLTIGSKNFSEQVLLGKIALLMLQAAGAEVTDLTNIPGSASSRQAQLDGELDAMWEYTGTGWLAYLGEDKPIPDEQEQYEAVRDADLEQNGLIWLPPAPMNNTYGFAVTEETQQEYGITKLSELKDVPREERTMCVESEFVDRPDGLNGMLDAYDVPLGSEVPRDNLRTLQTGAIYDATANGDCNFGEVFTTDGRILALDLTVLEDDRSFFPKYNVSFVVQEDVLEEHPQIEDVIQPVAMELTDEVLLELNAQIDVEGREPVDVALEWLTDEGFLAGGE